MNYVAWDWKAIEGRVIEMAEILRLLPRDKGPQEYGSAMPEIVRRYDEAYGFETATYHRKPSGAELARMDAVFAWVNNHLGEADRKLLYAWSWVKVRRGMKIAAFAAENDMSDRMLRREIVRACQLIANNLNRQHAVRLNSEDCAVSENQGEHGQSDVTYQTCATHWIAPGAKPIHDPYSPELANLIARLEQANEQREKREARRRKKLEAYEAAAVLSGQQAA